MQQGSIQNDSLLKLLEYNQRSLEFEKTGPAERRQATNWSGVIFRTGDYRLICGIDDISEILDFPEITAIPMSQPWLLGLANVRGNLVSVCDLMWFLTGIRSPVTARTRLLLTNLQGHPVAILIDEVFGQRHLNTDTSRNSKIYMDTVLAPYVSREYKTGDEIWGEFDIQALMAMPDFMSGSLH